MLLRTMKRRTSLELKDETEFCQIEFRDKDAALDFNLSVYKITPSRPQIIQTVAEHMAGARLGLGAMKALDLADLDGPRLEKTPGTTGFKFTEEAHHELRFDDKEALLGFARVLLASSGRQSSVEKAEIKGYVQERLSHGDEEWTQFLADNPKWCPPSNG